LIVGGCGDPQERLKRKQSTEETSIDKKHEKKQPFIREKNKCTPEVLKNSDIYNL